MRKTIFNFFYFTRSERNGTMILIIMIFLSLLAPTIHQRYFADATPPHFLATSQITTTALIDTIQTTKLPAPIYQDFNPNTASKATFIALGISPKVSQTILNFRAKGGRFDQAEDLQKIYGLSPEKFTQLRPYIKIPAPPSPIKTTPKLASIPKKPQPLQLISFDPNKVTPEELSAMGLPRAVVTNLSNYRNSGGKFYQPKDVAKLYAVSPELYQKLLPFINIKITATSPPPPKLTTPVMVDINQADVEEWQELPGIRPYQATRIVKFREILGGFHSIEQVAETYSLPDSTFQQIKTSLQVSPIFRPILVNTATYRQLLAHPYLNAKQAQAIIRYREQHGPYRSMKTFDKLPALTPETRRNITPYLSLDYPF